MSSGLNHCFGFWSESPKPKMLESKSIAASARGYVFLQSRFKETLKAQAVPRK